MTLYAILILFFISRKFRTITRVLVTQLLDESHTNVFSSRHNSQNHDWKLNGKVVAVENDNAAKTAKAIEPEGCKLTHSLCFAHSMSLVVKAAI